MITKDIYRARRQRLSQSLPPKSVAIIPSAKAVLRNGDSHYRFRQRSDFEYLTGFQESDAVLCLYSEPDTKSILFHLEPNPSEEQWTGKRLGQDLAPAVLGVDEAYPLSAFETEIPKLWMGLQAIVYDVGQDSSWDQRIIQIWQKIKAKRRSGSDILYSIHDLAPILGEMRVIKSEQEVALMREAARMTVLAHQRAMKACPHLQYEYELEAELVYEFMRQGCRSVAYDSIVACGEQACVLHYTANDKPLVPGELVLIDAGGEFGSYAADVTRTFPVNGRFSPEQRAIYELVLQAQKAGMSSVQPGAPWDGMQSAVVSVITQGLVDLGLLQGNVQDLIESGAYKPFYMHSSGHWLGLDVHDCGIYRQDGHSRLLEPGMVLTVEPGIYISKQMTSVNPRWHGIGIRIEDDILVTADGFDNLTGALVSEVSDIEAWICGG